MRVALIDYGAGNLTSVRHALRRVGLDVATPSEPAALAGAAGIVVPGVGHFGATRALDAAWRQAVRDRITAGIPLLGICLGMQWLFEGSTEASELSGLALFEGACGLLPASAGSEAGVRVKVPHVGWNALDIGRRSWLLEGLDSGVHTYFTHSYAAPVTAATAATTTHGRPFASVVEVGRVAGVQFHPEKSGVAGLTILGNFARLVRTA